MQAKGEMQQKLYSREGERRKRRKSESCRGEQSRSDS